MQRQTRLMERSSSMAREKRGLEAHGVEDGPPDPKRPKVPALASVIVEALKMDSLQKLCSSLEPILRRVVSEEVERALAKLGTPQLTGRASPQRLEGPDGRNLQLHFRSRLSLPLFTGGKVEGEQGAAIHVVLLDANTGSVVTTGPESAAKLDVIVLEGDFNNEDDDDWTVEDFESHTVKEREGKRPLLTGELQVTLKEGVGTLGDLTFTDNSSWIRSRKFRIGLKISSGYCEGVRIREAKTDAFTVKDHRGELYKKHYPPALKDEVWRLEKIGKDGSFHKRLNKAGINTVEEFLRLVVRDTQRLRNVLGSGMSNKMWESLVEHSKTCVLGGKLYVYYQDDTRNVGVVFNNIYELRGLIAGDQYYSAETLDESQKVYVDSLVKKAYDNWMHVVEYDGRALATTKSSRKSSLRNEDAAVLVDFPPSFGQQASLPLLPNPLDQTSGDPAPKGGDPLSSEYVENASVRYQTSAQHVPSNTQLQFEISPFSQNQLVAPSPVNQMSGNNATGLALGLPQGSDLGYQFIAGSSGQTSTNFNTYDEWGHQRDGRGIDEYISEEEIRMRSHEMLENEDMQNLLRIISMGGTTVNVSDDGYAYSSFMPTPAPSHKFGEERNRSSGKAVVGWLKLKAALRWGIFIRKRAAERRAKLVELDD